MIAGMANQVDHISIKKLGYFALLKTEDLLYDVPTEESAA